MTKIEIFDVKVVVETFNKQLDMNRMVKPRVQLMEMTPLDLPSFQMTSEQTKFSIGNGIEFLCRVDCFKSFRVTPIYIYICTENDQKICGGGIDIAPLFIDAFRKSGQEQRHRASIDLENYYREVIGNCSFRVYVTHISSNINDVECLDDELREIEYRQNEQKLDLIIQDDAEEYHKSKRSAMKKSTRDFPSLPDLLHMYFTYHTLSNDFEDEAFVTDEKALTQLQARWTRKMKQVQELRRKADVGQNLSELSDYNQITSSNAAIETPSDFSESEDTLETRDLLREIRRELNIRLPKKKKPKQNQQLRPTQPYTQQMLQIQPTQQVYVKTEVLNQDKKPKEKPLKEIGDETLGRLNRKAQPVQEQKQPEPKKPRKKPTNRLAELAVKKYEPPKPPEPSPEEIKKKKEMEAKKKPKRLPPIILQTETIKKKQEEDLKPKSQTQKEPIRRPKKSPSPPKATTTTLPKKVESKPANKDNVKPKMQTYHQTTKTITETRGSQKQKEQKKPTAATDSQKIPEKGKVTSSTLKGKTQNASTTTVPKTNTKTDTKGKKQTLSQTQKDKKSSTLSSKEQTKPDKKLSTDTKESTKESTKDTSKEPKKDKKQEKPTKDTQEQTNKESKEIKTEKKEGEKQSDSQIVDTSKLSKEDLKDATDEGKPIKSSIEKGEKKKEAESSFADSFLTTSTTQQSSTSKQQTDKEKKTDEKEKEKSKEDKSEPTDIVIDSFASTDKKESSKLKSDIEIDDSFYTDITSTIKTETTTTTTAATKSKDEIVVDSFISDTSSVVKPKDEEKKKEEDKSKSKDDIIDSFISETSSVVQQPEQKKEEEEKKKDDDVEIVDSFISTTSTTKQTDTKINDDLDMGTVSSASSTGKEKEKSKGDEIISSFLSTTTSAISQKDKEKEKEATKESSIANSFESETPSVSQPSKPSLVLDSFDTSDVSKQIPLKEEKIEDGSNSKSKQTTGTSYSSLGEPLNIDSTGTIGSKKSSAPKSDDTDSSFGFSSDDEIDALLNGSSKGKDALIGTLTNDQEKQIDEDIQGDDFLSLMNTENIQAKKSNADDFGDSVLSSDLSI